MSLCDQRDAELAQVASETRHSPATSPRDRHTAGGNDLSGFSRGQLTAAASAALQEGGAQSSSAPEMSPAKDPPRGACQRQHAEEDVSAQGWMDAEGAPVSGGSTVDALRQELEMLQVDCEREHAMRHMTIQQAQADQQQWYQRAMSRLADLNPSSEQTLLDEQRLEELLIRRRAELSRSRDKLTQRRLEVAAKKQTLCNADNQQRQGATSAQELIDEDAWARKCKKIDDDVARIRVKRDALQEDRLDRTPWRPEVAGA